MDNELARKPNLKNSQNSILASSLGILHQDKCMHHSECLGNHHAHRVHYHLPIRRIPYLEEPTRWPMVGRSPHYG